MCWGLGAIVRVLASILMRRETRNQPSEIVFEQRSDVAIFKRITLSTVLGQGGDGDSGVWERGTQPQRQKSSNVK